MTAEEGLVIIYVSLVPSQAGWFSLSWSWDAVSCPGTSELLVSAFVSGTLTAAPPGSLPVLKLRRGLRGSDFRLLTSNLGGDTALAPSSPSADSFRGTSQPPKQFS